METATRTEPQSELLWEYLDAYFASLSLATMQGQLSTWKKWLKHLKVIERTELGAARLLRAIPIDAKAYMKARVDAKGRAPRNPGASDRVSGRTCNKEWANLRTIYNRAFIETGLLKTPNPFVSKCPVAQGGRQKRPTLCVEFDKVRAMIEWPSKHTAEGKRDRCWLAISFGGALRISETTKLRICDVHKLPGGRFYLTLRETKNGEDCEKQALMPIAHEPLAAYLDHRLNVDWASGTEPLLVGYDAGDHATGPASHQTLRRRFAELRDELGLKNVTPHSMRATTITKMLVEGEDHRAVQDFSRHSSVAMVERYDKRMKSDENSPANRVDFE
jgi:integrase